MGSIALDVAEVYISLESLPAGLLRARTRKTYSLARTYLKSRYTRHPRETTRRTDFAMAPLSAIYAAAANAAASSPESTVPPTATANAWTSWGIPLAASLGGLILISPLLVILVFIVHTLVEACRGPRARSHQHHHWHHAPAHPRDDRTRRQRILAYFRRNGAAAAAAADSVEDRESAAEERGRSRTPVPPGLIVNVGTGEWTRHKDEPLPPYECAGWVPQPLPPACSVEPPSYGTTTTPPPAYRAEAWPL